LTDLVEWLEKSVSKQLLCFKSAFLDLEELSSLLSSMAMAQEEDIENLNKRKLSWFQDKMIVWGEQNLRVFPWRQTQDPYSILVAEFLLQQTDAPRVLPVYQLLLKRCPTLRALADAPAQEIADILKPLGLHYRTGRLHQIARAIVEDPVCEGKIPNDEVQLISFKGIGRYIARSICAHAFGQSTAVLDTNVSRILQRFFGLTSHRKRPRDDQHLWETVQKIAPDTNMSLWNLTLIDFGAVVCTHRNPNCSDCPLQVQCLYFHMKQES
jgi:A/G-specific adenine glycosylase